MAAINLEVNSFVTKFQSLVTAGCEASLNFKTEDGKLSVSMNADFLLPSSHNYYQHSFYQCAPYGRRRSPAYYRRQSRRKNRASKSSDGSAETEVKVKTNDPTQVKEFKSTTRRDDSSLKNSDVAKEPPITNGADKVHSVSIEDSLASQENQPISSIVPLTTIAFEHSAAAADDIEFGDKVSQILKTLSNEPPQEHPVTFSEHNQEISQPMKIEDKCEVDILDRPLCEVTRQEFYDIMNSRLGLNIQPT